MITSKLTNVVSCIFIYFVSIFFFLSSNSFSFKSAVFPKAIALILIALSTVLMIQTFLKKDVKDVKNKEIMNKKTIFTILASIIYILIMSIVGFFIITPIYIFTIITSLGYRNKKIAIITSLIATFIIYCVFEIILGVEMPKGPFT